MTNPIFDLPGGEVIKLEITVNNKPVMVRYATKINNLRYKLDNGVEIVHQRNQGVMSLVNKILVQG